MQIVHLYSEISVYWMCVGTILCTNIHLFQTKEFKKDFCGLLFFLRRHFLHRQHQGQHLNLSNTLSSWINACKSDITITHSCSSQHFSLRLDSSPVKIHILIEYIHMQSIHVMFEKERKCHTLHFVRATHLASPDGSVRGSRTEISNHVGAHTGQMYSNCESSPPLMLLSEQIGCQMKSVCQEKILLYCTNHNVISWPWLLVMCPDRLIKD